MPENATITLKPKAQDLLRGMSPDVYRSAFSKGMSLSAYLEQEDPSEGYDDGLDTFGRLLKEANLMVRSDPNRGYYADTFEAFYENEHTRALIPEFVRRVWYRVATGQDPSTRASASSFTSLEQPYGSVANPFFDSAQPRIQQLQPVLPLSEFVTLTTPIRGDAYRAFYLTEPTNKNDYRLTRIAEGAEIPRVKLVGGQHMTRLHKYGRALEATYEVLRRQRIDMIALHIARMAIQAETDKVATAIDVMINGDGNSNTAATSYNLTTLDAAASAGTLTLKGWLNFKLQWLNPYRITTAVAQVPMALQAMLLSTGSANIPLSVAFPNSFGGMRPLNQSGLSDGVGFGWTSDAPSNKIVGWDNRFALERVYEVGSDINEIERFVMRQTQALTMSEVEGYNCLDPNSVKVLVVNA